MGVFSRLRDIVSSNINSMLDKAEDPEKLIKLMIQEMEDTLVEIKTATAGAMATTKKIERELGQTRTRGEQWEDRVNLAVTKGRDDLAREALVQKRLFQQRAEALEREVTENEDIVAKYKADIVQLEEKLQDAREKHRLLAERHRHAAQSRRARETIRRADHNDAFVRFENFENRIERMEAAADLVNYQKKPSLEDEFSTLEGEDDVEAELTEIKERFAAESVDKA